MANVDLNTKIITGATLGTKKYYHEVGHLEFEKECSIGNNIRVIQDLSFKALVFLIGLNSLLVLDVFKILIIFTILASCLSQIFEESWCWKYASNRIKEDDTNKQTNKI